VARHKCPLCGGTSEGYRILGGDTLWCLWCLRCYESWLRSNIRDAGVIAVAEWAARRARRKARSK
jgi:hypothetical protein